MTLTLSARVLWAVGFFVNAALLAVLLYKRRYRILPWFTAFIGAGCGYTIALYLTFRFGSKGTYAATYYICDFLELLLQISVIWEIARLVLRRSGSWVEGARVRLTVMGLSAPLLAASMALLMHPFAESRIDSLSARASLFTTIFVFLLFVAVVAVSHQLGLSWRSYPLRVSAGLVLWVCAGFFTDTLHAYWRTLGHFTLLENVHILAYQGVSILWCIAFWRPERTNISLSETEKIRLQALQRGLEYGQR